MDTKLGLSHLRLQAHLALATPMSMRHLLTIKCLQAALMKCDWREAAFLSSTCMGMGYASYQRLMADAITSPESIRIQMMTDTIRAGVAQLGPPSERMVTFQRLLAEVRGQAADVQERWTAPLAALASDDMAPLLDVFTEPRSPFDPALEHSLTATISLLTYGLHASLHAEFNLVFDRQQATVPTILKWGYVDAFATITRDFEKTLWQWQETLYHSLQEANPANRARDVQPHIDAITSAIERDLPDFVRKQAVAVAAMNALNESPHGDLVAKIGEPLIRAGTLTRMALATYAASHVLGIGLVLPRTPERLQSVIRIATSVPFDRPAEVRIPVLPIDLVNVGEGDVVQISGLVTSIHMARDPADLRRLACITLADPHTGTSANVVGVYIHAPHRGLAVGAWLQVTGRYRGSSSLFDGDPGIEIERQPLSTTAHEQWRIAFLMTAREWIEVWPYALDMAWSLSPHMPTGPNDLAHLGAGELIYRKPIPATPDH